MSAGVEGEPERAASVMTLGVASVRLGKPSNYFRIRRLRWQDHEKLPFPQPVHTGRGGEEYDLVELAVWDERRKKLNVPSKRATKTNEES